MQENNYKARVGISDMTAAQAANELTITSKLHSISESLAFLEQGVSILRGHLFGEGEDGPSRIPPSNMTGIVDDVALRIASLCSDLRTVNQRVGCPPEINLNGNSNFDLTGHREGVR